MVFSANIIILLLSTFKLVASFESTGTCPSISFESVLYSQCPDFKDLRCVRSMTRTRIGPYTINCALVEPSKNPEMKILNATELINSLQYSDPFGRSVCSIVMFYSQNCIFSQRVGGYVYLLAKLFPQLQVFAVNLHQRSSILDHLINQHGIAATPIILLFENNVAKIRLYDESSSFRSLAEILLHRTDLKLPTGIKPEELSTYGVANEDLQQEYSKFILEFFNFDEIVNGIDRYFILAVIILLLNLSYFLYFSSRINALWPQRR